VTIIVGEKFNTVTLNTR